MRKFIIMPVILMINHPIFAINDKYSAFQDFDNEINIGYGRLQSTFGPYITPTTNSGYIMGTVNIVNFEGEHLFNNGVWVDVVANMSFGAGPTGTPPVDQVNYANPVNYGINAKTGYAFPILKNYLQLTPYGIIGLNNVYNSVITPVTNLASPISSNAFEYTFGLGAKFEYRINNTFLLYADELVDYNWDSSGIQNGKQSQNNMAYTSTLGLKANVINNLQLGLKGFWTAYEPQSGAGMSIDAGYQMYELQTAIGGMLTIGLTY